MPPPRLALVLNPVSPRAAAARRAVESAAAAAGLGTPLVLETTIEDPGPGQTREALARGVERVVVAGGDGTARLVAGELAAAVQPAAVDDSDDLAASDDPVSVARDTRATSPAPPTLGLVPVGTANLFARTARLPLHDLRAAARLAVTGPGRPTDLGLARFTREAGGSRSQDDEHPFLVVAGLGHDAATLAAVPAGVKARARWLAYFLPGLRRLRSPGFGLTVRLDGDPLAVDPLWSLLAVNAARLPAGARVVPGARIDDGLLHVVLVSPAGLRGWARVARTGLGPVRAAYPSDHRALRYRSASGIEVATDRPVPAQADGDVLPDVVTARVTIRPGALSVAR